MVFVQKWPFFQLFFSGKIGQENFFYEILEQKKKPIYAKKRRSLKSRKIDIFLKVLTHGFGPKMADFPTFFFQAIGRENVFYDILHKKKTPLQPMETKSSKSRKTHIFPKGFTHSFGPKFTIFPIFFFHNKGHENVFYDILNRKNAFLGHKNKKFTKSKN